MGMEIALIPAAMFIMGIGMMIYMKKKRGSLAPGYAQQEMKRFVKEMVPASAVSGVEIDESARKVRIAVGDEVKKYQFKEKDCFGGDHEEALRDFFRFLRGIRG